MTQGQRALLGVAAAFVISGILWALIASAFAQSPPEHLRGNTHATVYFESPDAVTDLCAMIGAPGSRACANRNEIIIANPCVLPYRRESYANDLCHEIGHVNGWGVGHGDPR